MLNLGPGALWAMVRKPAWLQAIMRRRVEWPSEAEVSNWNLAMADAQDDAAHPSESPFYFEWWYFDMSFGEGEALSLTFHLTDVIKPASASGSISISVFAEGRRTWHRFVPYQRTTIRASSSICDAQIGPNRCWQEGNSYRIQVNEPNLQLDLCFDTVIGGWRPGNGMFRFGDGEGYFAWLVAQPKARAHGTLLINGVTRSIDGWGYHDHNWGTVPLLDSVSKWSWGRAYLGDLTLVYADIWLTRRYGGSRVMPFALFDGHTGVISSFLQQNEPHNPQNDFMRTPERVDLPEGWRLAWQQAESRLELNLHTRHVLEKSDLLAGPSWRRAIIERLIAHPYYMRCYTSAEGTWQRDDGAHIALQGHAICEQMHLGR
jgi:predicted secreted hydrolase